MELPYMLLRIRDGPQQPNLLQAPNLSFHSCLYFSHHSSSHVERVSPQRMILYRSCSSAVHATPSISPLVTMPRLRRPWRAAMPLTARSASSRKVRILLNSVSVLLSGSGEQPRGSNWLA